MCMYVHNSVANDPSFFTIAEKAPTSRPYLMIIVLVS